LARSRLESRQGEGTYIASKPVESLVNPLAAFISTEKDSQMELFEMRRVIEPQLAYLAAERATQEDIALMEQALELQGEAVARGEVGTDVDKTFHYIMAKATGRPEKSIARHRQVLDAIKAGDAKRAAKLMRAHLEDIEEGLFSAHE
jgi:GntR family transcriptional repressor for pyruvate dehydrogenase complex